jgi:small subunit ribosomal protein S7
MYNSVKVTKLINYVMEQGKKEAARKIVYKVMEDLKKDGDPVALLEQALENASPTVEVRSRRVGGANYQVPREVNPNRRLALGLRWIVDAAEGTKGKPMNVSLLAELQAAIKGEGSAVTKKETTHRMAEANKAFAHFAW